ncbi:MAG: DEAD/DEAH box helicase [Actinomycetota bacterium]|nr:DEAD/DEAH box helicase [Actinomycetota bacterium]
MVTADGAESTGRGAPGRFDPEFVARRLAAPSGRQGRLTHLELLEAREAHVADWPGWTHPAVRAAYLDRGVTVPWSHQAQAADMAWHGQHTIVATGTASGKSLAYTLPALTAIASSVDSPADRGDTVLYLAPTKALAHDQCAALQELAVPGARATTYDGDSSREERDWTRNHANYVLTNPDMLHRTMLPGHAQWALFWGALRFVVVDECHHYRGVFGSHVAQILRRLRRIAAHYGANPTFVLASATTAEPQMTGARLIGAPMMAVTDDGSPRGPTAVALWEPPLTSLVGEQGAPVRRSALAETADLVADLVAQGTRTLAFVRSRRGVETVALQVRQLLAEVDPDLARRVASYRGGYLPEDRRELERQLKSGELLAVTSTNALELGIDIDNLDAVVMAGFPGTRASMWQQVGRSGREGQGGLGILVARDDPLDTYLVTHPEALLGPPVEATVFDPANPYVVAPHLCAAAQELPLRDEDLPLFAGDVAAVVASLVEGGYLRRRSRGWFWTRRDRAADLADIRSSGGNPVRIVEGSSGRLVGTVDAGSAHSAVHQGAVYVHMGQTYLVSDYDHVEGVALVEAAAPEYSTTARDVTDIAIVTPDVAASWGDATVTFGSVQVSARIVSFLKRRVGSGEVLGEEPLDLPERQLLTKAVWWTLSPRQLERSGVERMDIPGAAHAAAHASIGLLPLFATCDRGDIGGVSTALHEDTGLLTVFVYDGHPGGAGFAEQGYTKARAWLIATREAISSCGCDEGCPSCVQSPKCGNGNLPLDKRGAVQLLDVLLAGSS